NSMVFDLWAEVLTAIPNSRLLMYRDTLTSTAQNHIRRQFAQRGVAVDRLDLHQGTDSPGYLKVCEEMDVALDTYPFAGGVITCESLWMGVPVLTLSGATRPSRNSAAILARIGLGDWSVKNTEDFVALAKQLPQRLNELASLRSELRQRTK